MAAQAGAIAKATAAAIGGPIESVVVTGAAIVVATVVAIEATVVIEEGTVGAIAPVTGVIAGLTVVRLHPCRQTIRHPVLMAVKKCRAAAVVLTAGGGKA